MTGAMRANWRSGLTDFEIRSGPLRGFGLRHVALVVVVTILFEILGQLAWLDLRAMSFKELPQRLAICLMAILAAVAADNAPGQPRIRFARYPAAVLLASAIATAVFELWSSVFPQPDRNWTMVKLLGGGRFQFLCHYFLSAAYSSSIVVAFHALFEAQRRAGAELHAARIAALTAQQSFVEDDLRAMQARIDPELLFDALTEVDRAYARGVGAGQERLDALIRFLRAALPGDGNGSSTVERERELTEAYVALVGVTLAPSLVTEISVDPAARNDLMPAMLLLPLVRWALEGWQAARFAIRVRRRGRCIELAVESSGPAASDRSNQEIDRVRERLAQLYPDGARLDARSDGGRRRAVLEFPLMPATAS
jgi:hypothetical protein